MEADSVEETMAVSSTVGSSMAAVVPETGKEEA